MIGKKRGRHNAGDLAKDPPQFHIRRKHTWQAGIRIVLEGLKGEDSNATICHRVGTHPNLYYSWSKAFLESGKMRLRGYIKRKENSDEVMILRLENGDLNKIIKKSTKIYEDVKLLIMACTNII